MYISLLKSINLSFLVINIVPSNSSNSSGLSTLKFFRCTLFVAFILFAWLVVRLVFIILVIAAQVIVMSQLELIILKYHIVSSFLSKVFSHCVYSTILRSWNVWYLGGKVAKSWVNLSIKLAIHRRLSLYWGFIHIWRR